MDIASAIDEINAHVPEFSPLYNEFLKRWRHWPGETPGYAVITCFGQEFLAPLLDTSNNPKGESVDVIGRSLSVVERLLGDGDDLVVDAVYFGVIEYIFRKSRLPNYVVGPLTQHELARAKLAAGLAEDTR